MTPTDDLDDIKRWFQALADRKPGDPIPEPPPIDPLEELEAELSMEWGQLWSDRTQAALEGRLEDAGMTERERFLLYGLGAGTTDPKDQ